MLVAAPVRIGLVRTANAGPLYVALEAGYFHEAGLEPRVEYLPSDAAVEAAVAKGRVDVGFAALSAPFYRAAAAGGFRLIASQVDDQSHFPLSAFLIGKRAHDAGFIGVRDLPHKKIALSDPESGLRYALNRVTERFRLEPATPVFSKEHADAVLLPYPEALRKKGDGYLLRLSDLAQWQQSAAFIKAGADKALIESFLTAYRRGAGEYSANFLQYDDGGDFIAGPHHAAYLAAISRESRVKPELLSVTKTYCDPHANLDVEDIGRQIKFWQSLGKLDPAVTAAQLLLPAN
jgi:NitT/TauT family transport system substrate-binding protein